MFPLFHVRHQSLFTKSYTFGHKSQDFDSYFGNMSVSSQSHGNSVTVDQFIHVNTKRLNR